MATRSKRVRWIVLVVLALVVAGVGAAVVLSQPELSDARDRVDARWTPLRAPLIARYEALDGVSTAVTDAGAGERAVTKDLDAALARWSDLALQGDNHNDPAAEATSAGELESLARRMRANIAASDRLNTNEGVQVAIGAFDQSVPPPAAVTAYNRAARAYEDQRTGVIRAIVAGILGYESRPQLVLGP
jgi:hypothetical protein